MSMFIKSVHEKKDVSWEDVVSYDALSNVSIADILSGKKRFIVVAEIDSKVFYIVTCDSDYNAVKKKYPNSAVIHVGQLIMLAKRRLEMDDYAISLPSIMIAMDVFPGTKISESF
jgi:hypothetical protein